MKNFPDTLYATPIDEPGAFTFDEDVARVFPDMISRSVPGYSTIIGMTGVLAGKYARSGSNFYDLGSSLGASTLAMRKQIRTPHCTIYSVDNSAAMQARARDIIDADSAAAAGQPPAAVDLLCVDIEDCNIENACMVVLNFTLQFVAKAQRGALIEKIYAGLRPGGIMVLSEKVTFEDPHLDQLNIELHHQFKKANGYSELEIAQKRSALENVLLPESLGQHRARIAAAGFSSCDVWFQCFNFASLIALK